MVNLRHLWDERHGTVESGVGRYGTVYAQRRAAMVFDVVASRQRDYEKRVLRLVSEFEQRPAAAGLAVLAKAGPGTGLSLMAEEETTVRDLAAALHRCWDERGLDEDNGVRQWALEAEPIRLAPRLDTYAGNVSGIGIALFAYLRMRSGADAIKPDTRVRSRLNRLGFDVPAGDAALVLLAEAAADELGIAPPGPGPGPLVGTAAAGAPDLAHDHGFERPIALTCRFLVDCER